MYSRPRQSFVKSPLAMAPTYVMSPRSRSLPRMSAQASLAPRASMAPRASLGASLGSMPPRASLGMSPRASMAPRASLGAMPPRASMALRQSLGERSPLLGSRYDSGMMVNGIISVLDLIFITVGIYLLVTDPAYKPEMSADEMDKHKKDRNTWGYVLLGIGIVMFFGLVGKWMNSRSSFDELM